MNAVISEARGWRQMLPVASGAPVVSTVGARLRGSQAAATSRASSDQTASDRRQLARPEIGTATAEAVAAARVMNAV
ncbi:hypothetical protein Ari01nite_94880 [Paractinoplanes rishiriensis]|uniref:Uncharacterized protein n=1 Tax=Paractinoplanes rishiriensis TaxID=1050105 RepID=A0A919MZV7_9ACTN|nr:hypothetical protein Ari01nite_94880 [Actinoplanes rishiriensis]